MLQTHRLALRAISKLFFEKIAKNKQKEIKIRHFSTILGRKKLSAGH